VNIYTATKWERANELACYNDQIRDLGHTITHDWTTWETDEEQRRDPTWWETNGRKAAGMLDYAGVMQCDLLIYWDHEKANGARWETGMAIGAGKQVWVVDYQFPVIFDVLPQVKLVWSWDEALMLLAGAVPAA
jgi:hypothetical protein